ncbi:MAG: tripartite tricarboxylate transporter permease, partial [Candidatus Micrarchaeia archaeon]
MGAGLIAGTISGILPGIHSNTIAQIFDSITLNPVLMGVAIVAASSVYTIISFLPSIFLCVPESSTILSVLPGQKMLREGKGLYAVYISSFSALIALIISIILLPLFFVLIPTTYLIIRSFMAFLLALICLV